MSTSQLWNVKTHTDTHTHLWTCDAGKYIGFDNISIKCLVIGLKKLEYSFSCYLQAREQLAICNFFVLLLWLVHLYTSGK